MRSHEFINESDDIMSRGTRVDHYSDRDIRNFDPTIQDPIDKLEQRLDRENLQKLVKSAFVLLPPRIKEILIYRLWDELTVKQTAKKLNVYVQYVKDMENKAIEILSRDRVFRSNIRQYSKPDYPIPQSDRIQNRDVLPRDRKVNSPIHVPANVIQYIAQEYSKGGSVADLSKAAGYNSGIIYSRLKKLPNWKIIQADNWEVRRQKEIELRKRRLPGYFRSI